MNIYTKEIKTLRRVYYKRGMMVKNVIRKSREPLHQ